LKISKILRGYINHHRPFQYRAKLDKKVAQTALFNSKKGGKSINRLAKLRRFFSHFGIYTEGSQQFPL
jgi:hypothetical protein